MIENMFSVPLYHSKVENWSHIKHDILSLHSSVESDIEFSNEDPVFTNFYVDNKIMIEKISTIFGNDIKKFLIEFGFSGCTINSSWFEKSTTGNYHHPHNHGSTGYSAVCFVSYNKKEHIPTHFISPFNNFINGNSLNYIPKEIEEGSIIFFPSSILHYTVPNKSIEERLVISFNLEVF